MKIRTTTSNKPWSSEQARQILAEQRRSGKSVAGFAKERGLVPERLYWWIRKPQRDGTRAGKELRSPERGMSFVEVSPAPASEPSGGATAQDRIEVVLTSGRRIVVPSGFAAADMQRLVAVLEGTAC